MSKRASTAKAIDVRPLRRDDWPLLAKLFGSNGACGGCWCMWWRVPRGGELWKRSKGEPNKRAFRKLIAAGQVHGLLALEQGEPVGWCNIGPRGDFPRIERTRALRGEWSAKTWSLTCFFVPARHRGRGIATQLLRRAIELARELGAETLEGYPVREGTDRLPAAFAWTGVTPMFEREGFECGSDPSAPRSLWRIELRAAKKSRRVHARARD